MTVPGWKCCEVLPRVKGWSPTVPTMSSSLRLVAMKLVTAMVVLLGFAAVMTLLSARFFSWEDLVPTVRWRGSSGEFLGVGDGVAHHVGHMIIGK